MQTVGTKRVGRFFSANNVLVVGLVSLFAAGYLFTLYLEADQIRDDFSMTTGQISELAGEGNDASGVATLTRYRYRVNGSDYEGESAEMSPCEGYLERSVDIKAATYSVIYSNANPKKSRLLVSPSHFELYGIPYPPTMREVFEQLWPCK